MATPKKRLKDRLINSDGPEEYNSASEECDNEIALSSPAQSDQNDLEAESGSQLSQTGSGMVQKIQNQSQNSTTTKGTS